MNDERTEGAPGNGGASPQLTADDIAVLADLAKRRRARLARGGSFEATVRKNNWTHEQAILNGARNDLRTAADAHSRAVAAYDAALENLTRAERVLTSVRERLTVLDRDMDAPVIVMGCMHSGTSWLAQTVDRIDGWHGHHELGKNARKQLIESKDLGRHFEVDSRLVEHIPKLRRVYPEARLVHLIRDGRKVVRSLMNGVGMTFELACEWWVNAVQKCDAESLPTVRLEDLLAGPGAFNRLGIAIPEDVWRDAVANPVNATKEHKLPPHEEWTDEQTETFWRICGDVMGRHGYR